MRDISVNDLQKAKEIVNTSGNSFHCKVVEYFRSKDWFLSISPYYLDGSTSKPREIDLVAEKAWPHNSSFSNPKPGNVTIKLFVECKYLPTVSVFWFDRMDSAAALSWLSKSLPGAAQNIFLKKHHYLTENDGVAKLFASENSKQLENEPIYKAINQSLNSVVNLRRSGSIVPSGTNGYNKGPIFTLEMPVVICNDFSKAYRTNISIDEDPKNIDKNFQIEVNYAYVDKNKNDAGEYFLIDVVDFTKIDTFLDLLEFDAALIMELLD